MMLMTFYVNDCVDAKDDDNGQNVDDDVRPGYSTLHNHTRCCHGTNLQHDPKP